MKFIKYQFYNDDKSNYRNIKLTKLQTFRKALLYTPCTKLCVLFSLTRSIFPWWTLFFVVLFRYIESALQCCLYCRFHPKLDRQKSVNAPSKCNSSSGLRRISSVFGELISCSSTNKCTQYVEMSRYKCALILHSTSFVIVQFGMKCAIHYLNLGSTNGFFCSHCSRRV